MSNISIIIQREFNERVRKKSFIIVADADHDTLADIVSRLDKMYA